MKLWFVTNGPQGAWEGPGAMSGSVAHASPLKKIAKRKNFLGRARTILSEDSAERGLAILSEDNGYGAGLSCWRIARDKAALSCRRRG